MSVTTKGRTYIVRLCKDCPVCVDGHIGTGRRNIAMPYCIPGKRYLPAGTKRDPSCPQVGTSFTWPKL
jgi:hypothetical protein